MCTSVTGKGLTDINQILWKDVDDKIIIFHVVSCQAIFIPYFIFYPILTDAVI